MYPTPAPASLTGLNEPSPAYSTMATDDDGGESLKTVGHDNLSRPPQESKSFLRGGSSRGKHDEQAQEGESAAAAASADDDDTEWPSGASSYELVSRIGQGAFATVYLATCRTSGSACAIKVLDLENVDANFIDIRLEVQTMRLSQHPNILACYTNFVKDTELWLVTQLMDRGSSLRCLQGARKKLRRRRRQERDLTLASLGEGGGDGDGNSREALDLRLEDHITYILAETLKGLQYIHSNGQIHRDIKAGNILLDGQANVRIAGECGNRRKLGKLKGENEYNLYRNGVFLELNSPRACSTALKYSAK